MPECQNCGGHVSERYVNVFEPEGVDHPRCCPQCPDLIRRGAHPEPARSSRKSSGGAEYQSGGPLSPAGREPARRRTD
jgi:hypothetical protein